MQAKSNMDKKNPPLRVARIAVLSALCVVGAYVHPPSPIQSVAFDSAPGFFAALFFGVAEGATVLGIGHLATSVINGFPLGIFHFPIAGGMALAGVVTATLNRLNRKWGYLPASLAGIMVNTLLAFVVVPILGLAATLAFIPFLLLASALNVVAAVIVYLGVRGKLHN